MPPARPEGGRIVAHGASRGFISCVGAALERGVTSRLSLEQVHGAIAFYLGHQKEAEAYLCDLEKKWDTLGRTARPASAEIQQRIEEVRKRLLARQA
ncbi:hypothetical protein SBA6_240005 [Candidatus Sulfopaludibacter sp. SbA6]|nr:hypothetical protein SBA6_240005 [Candidatus Sulfopaludibacter sp. SbA6]